MSTWLDHWERHYIDRVRLLVEILPVLAQEPRFALKGGTAINLFEHDLPRLSVEVVGRRGRRRHALGGQSRSRACADRDDAGHARYGTSCA